MTSSVKEIEIGIFKDRVLSKRPLAFTEREKNILKKYITNITFTNSFGEILHNIDKSVFDRIFKGEDEWYYVFEFSNKGSHCYQCDQFDGLIEYAKKRHISESKDYRTINNTQMNPVLYLGLEFSENEIRAIQTALYQVTRRFICTKDKKNLVIDDRQGITQYEIIKGVDEWYYIHDYINKVINRDEGNYKCDQMRGLIECLLDLIKNKKMNENINLSTVYKRDTIPNDINESLTESLYQSINIRSYYDFKIGHNKIDCVDDDCSALKSFFRKNNITYQSLFLDKSDLLSMDINFKLHLLTYLSTTDGFILEKYDDEWFVLREGDFIYKCDTLDGVYQILAKYANKIIKESVQEPLYTILPLNQYYSFRKIHNVQDKLSSKIIKESKELDYDIISYQNFITILYDRVEFDSKDITVLNNWIQNNNGEVVHDDAINYLTFYLQKKRMSIVKFNDEWYGVMRYHKNSPHITTYKCDQLHGVIDCLTSLLPKPILESCNDYFTKIEYFLFKELLDKRIPLSDSDDKVVSPWIRKNAKSDSDGYVTFFCMGYRYTIMKSEDEWFYVVHYVNISKNIHDVYKCDQLEGLMVCLNHLVGLI